MLKIGDKVLYGATGVCRVEGLTKREIGRETKEYFVLKPLASERSSVLVPTDNEALLKKARKILSRKEITEIIARVPECEDVWVEDDTARREAFSEIIHGGDRLKLMLMVRSLYRQSLRRSAEGKRLHIADERILSEGERLLHDEFAAVLSIPANEVADFITANIKEKE